MKVDVSPPDGIGPDQAAQRYEVRGIERLWLGETSHDVFLQALRAVQETSRLEIGTSVAVAFARSPMNVAYLANDLQLCSGGRFTLGLGTQVKAHIQRRFGLPWSNPADRMDEYIRAVRAIWFAWRTGERLDFRGHYYAHTLMTPMFTPPVPASEPQIFLAAVGPRMTDVAGRVADGLITHAFTTERYLREVTAPRLARAAAVAGRQRSSIELAVSIFVVAGRNEEELRDLREATRSRLAFYASTPAYREILARHGWEAAAGELTRLSRTDAPDRWATMAALFDDSMLGTFAACGETPEDVAREIRRRFAGIAERVILCAASSGASGVLEAVADALRADAAVRLRQARTPPRSA
jgi:probable F420-dependent oxidoreductase